MSKDRDVKARVPVYRTKVVGWKGLAVCGGRAGSTLGQ